MDWASVAGVVLALAGLFIGHSLDGGKLASLVQPAAFAIVVIGTFGAVLLQTEAPTFMRGMRMLRWVFRPPPSQRAVLARAMRRRATSSVSIAHLLAQQISYLLASIHCAVEER